MNLNELKMVLWLLVLVPNPSACQQMQIYSCPRGSVIYNDDVKGNCKYQFLHNVVSIIFLHFLTRRRPSRAHFVSQTNIYFRT